MSARPTDEQREWLESSEVHGPAFADVGTPPRLIVFGAVPLTAALTAAAAGIGWRTFVIDPRERFLDAATFPAAERLVAAWPAEAVGELGGLDERTAVVALTHAPELDDDALGLALRSPAFYVAAMGSRRNQGRRRERLAAAGLSDAELARLSGPAGLDLGAETITEAALAILAEAVAALHDRSGGRLTESGNAIHAAGRP